MTTIPRPIAGTPALAAFSLAIGEICIPWSELVAPGAVRLLGIYGAGSVAAQDVGSIIYYLKMLRIYAAAIAAQVVYLESGGDGSSR